MDDWSRVACALVVVAYYVFFIWFMYRLFKELVGKRRR